MPIAGENLVILAILAMFEMPVTLGILVMSEIRETPESPEIRETPESPETPETQGTQEIPEIPLAMNSTNQI